MKIENNTAIIGGQTFALKKGEGAQVLELLSNTSIEEDVLVKIAQLFEKQRAASTEIVSYSYQGKAYYYCRYTGRYFLLSDMQKQGSKSKGYATIGHRLFQRLTGAKGPATIAQDAVNVAASNIAVAAADPAELAKALTKLEAAQNNLARVKRLISEANVGLILDQATEAEKEEIFDISLDEKTIKGI
jgi:hypothetical protein